MSGWERTLDIASSCRDLAAGRMTVQETAGTIADALAVLPRTDVAVIDSEHECLQSEFAKLSVNTDDQVDCFEELIQDLISWGELIFNDGRHRHCRNCFVSIYEDFCRE